MLPGVLNAWEPVALPNASPELAFDVSENAAPDQPAFVWRTDLPADFDQVNSILDQKDAQLEATTVILDAIPVKIDHLVGAIQDQREKGVSFDVQERSAVGAEEAELLAMLESLQPGATNELSFGLPDITGLDWKKAYDQFQTVFDQVQRMITHLAVVETRVGGVLLASTFVGWNGRTDTNLSMDASLQVEQAHSRSLAQALSSRIAMLKMVTVTVQSAVKISALVTMPGGAILALPAAWNYARQMMEQISQFQTAHS